MKSIDLKAFRKANSISQVELAEYLGVGQSFISQIEKGNRPMPKEYISTILANTYGWDTSMLEEKPNNSIGLFSGLKITHSHEAVAGNLGNTIKEVLENNASESPLMVYLEQKNLEKDAVIANQNAIIANQDGTIRDLLKRIEMLTKERDELLAEHKSVRKGDAENAAGSLSADAI